MNPWINSLLCKHEDRSFNPQNGCEVQCGNIGIYNPCTEQGHRRQRQENLQMLLGLISQALAVQEEKEEGGLSQTG